MRDVTVRPSTRGFKHINDGSRTIEHRAGTSPYLPIDAPPRIGLYDDPATTEGLVFRANLHGVSPVRRPSTPYDARDRFPYAMQSDAGPAAVGTRIGIALNLWSPVPHLRARMRMEHMRIIPAKPRQFFGVSLGQRRRTRAVVIPQPFAIPNWPTVINGRITGGS